MNFNFKNIIVLFLSATFLIACQKNGKANQKNSIINQEMNNERKNNVIKYFEKIDNGIFDYTYFDLFTDDVELYFPKYGYARGKEGIKDFGIKLGSGLKSIHHDIKDFNIIVSNKYIVVEGQEAGVTKNGIKWPDNKISLGKFCNVFEFEGNLIKRVHIYVDPDFTSEDMKRIEMLSQIKNGNY